MKPRVDICIVTHQSAKDLPSWFEAVENLDYRPIGVTLVDCASSDEGVASARRLCSQATLPTTLIPLDRNLGFAGGMNEALRQSSGPLVLLLNPDARPEPSYLSNLIKPLEDLEGQRIGGVTGRLVRQATATEDPRLDACGMRLCPTWRHFDRGSGALDRGQFLQRQKVFGATGAASLFLRSALEDVAIDGNIFDDTFHTFREDAELCFRLQERGWDVVFEPSAKATHRRSNLPSRRRQMSAEVNRNSLRNRYLLRFYHQTVLNFVWTLPFTLFRDLLALGYVLAIERSSLGAYSWLWRHRDSIRERRRSIQSRKTKPVEKWFLRSGVPL